MHSVSLNAGGGGAQPSRTRRLETAYPARSRRPKAVDTGGFGATGNGVGVAVVDTGIAGDLADFSVADRSDGARASIASVVTNPDATTARDNYGHGTHVAGIIAGNGNSPPTPTRCTATTSASRPRPPDLGQGLRRRGNATVLDVIYGLQFVVDHQDELNIRVVNLSLESTGRSRTRPTRSTRPSSRHGSRHRRGRRRGQPRHATTPSTTRRATIPT